MQKARLSCNFAALMRFLILFLVAVHAFPFAAWAQPAQPHEEPRALPRIAVAEFALLDDQGEFVPRLEAPNPDLARLARLVPAAIAARLVQSMDYDVLELDSRYNPFATPPGPDATEVPEAVSEWLAAGIADEIITGTAGMLQTSVVITAQRYGLQGGQPALLGAAAVAAARLGDALPLADSLIGELFPPEADIIARPIDQLFVVPSTLRLPIGRQGQLQPFAIDALGRPLSKVKFFFQSGDPSRVLVDERGVVTGIAPGQVNVTIRAVGRPSRTSPVTTATVHVVPPSFGLRAGMVVSGRDVEVGKQFRVGLRLTPTVDVRPRPAPQRQTPDELDAASSNPLSYLTNFFSSLLADGLFTIALDIEPDETMLFTLDAVQRTRTGFFGTGIGFASALGSGNTQGVVLRLTAGTQANLLGRSSLPFEVNADVIFPTGSSPSGSQVRVGVMTGFDLFQ